MNFNSEELKLIEAEKERVLEEILEELQTKSLRELFLETGDKEERIEEVREILENEYELLDYNEYMVKSQRGKEDEIEWKTYVLETLERIKEIEEDYPNYVRGGEGYISGYLEALNE